MKNALILHGLGNNSQGNWFPWLRKELEGLKYNCWISDLPQADLPDPNIWTAFLLENKHWNFENSILVGHSAGAVEILHLLQALPKNVKLDTCYFVSSFHTNLGWKELELLFTNGLILTL